MDRYRRDFVLALRHLRATPGFTLFAIVSLSCGLAITTTIYSVLYALVWKPLGIVDAQSVADITQSGVRHSAMSWADFQDLRSQQTSFIGLAASQQFQAAAVRDGIGEPVVAEGVNGEYFSTLGVGMLAGRPIGPADEDLSAPPVAVISESFWRVRTGAQMDVIGTSVRLAGHPFVIVGIAREPFRGLLRYSPTSIWVSITTAQAITGSTSSAGSYSDRSARIVSVKGRLREQMAITSAASEVSLIGRQLEATYRTPGRAPQRAWSAAIGEEADTLGMGSTIGVVVVGALLLVTIVACSNIANLSLARGSTRTQEFAIRVALGASRSTIFRELLVESSLIAVAGGLLAVGVAAILTTYASIDVQIGRGSTVTLAPELSAPVGVMAFCVLVLSLVVFGVWPALQLSSTQVQRQLVSGTVSTPIRWKTHRSLVAWQVTAAVALFLVAAAGFRALSTETNRESGVDIDRLAIAQVSFQISGRDERQTRRAVDIIVAQIRTQQSVQSVSASIGLPFGVFAPPAFLSIPERPFLESRDIESTAAYSVAGTPAIFHTLGIPLKNGRGFEERDAAGAEPVGILSESLARTLFPAGNPIGRTVLLGRTRRVSLRYPVRMIKVIGIVGDTDVWQLTKRGHVIYVPFTQESPDFLKTVTFAVRTPGEPEAGVGVLRSVIRRVDPELAISLAGVGSSVLAGPKSVIRAATALAALLGGTALVLAMAGLYGVLSHAMTKRTREFGVRMALGADAGAIMRLVIREGAIPVLDGLALGLAAGIMGRLALRAVLSQGVSVIDPIVFAVVPVFFAAAALPACYFPARRAAGFDPNVALREL